MTSSKDLFDALRDRSTNETQYKADFVWRLPPTPNGNQKFLFKVGQLVTSTNYKPNTPAFKIVSREKVNGFCRYCSADGMSHREQDLTKAQ